MSKPDEIYLIARAFMATSIGLFFLAVAIFMFTYWLEVIDAIQLPY
jgi:hypothetical protein